MSFTNAATVAKDAFIVKVREQLTLNMNGQHLSYEGLKIRLKTANRVAKIINKDMRNIIDEMICASSPETTGRLMSVMYLKMDEMINGCSNVHRNTYLTSEKEIIKIRKYAIKLQKNSRKALDILIELIQKVDKSLVPSYDLIIAKHNNNQSEYWLRTRKPINYFEDGDFDDPSDEDYKPYEHVSKTVIKNTSSRPKRNIPVVDYTGMDTIEPESEHDGITNIWYDNSIHYDSDYEFEEDDDEDDELDSCVDASNDDDSEYDPSDDEEFEDDHVLDFCDDDYAEESEEDDDDYEDEDEYSQEDSEFMDEYNNDPEYLLDEEADADEEDEELEFDEEDDNDSDYNPEDDADDTDDEFDFDEEDEDDDDDDYDYEDEEENDEEDRQFLSEYLNDPDYNPDEDNDEEDEYEYDFSYLNKTVDENGNIVLKAGIADDNDEEDPDYDPSEDEDDEDDDDIEEDIKYINNKNMVNICKRRFENGKVVYRWVKMSKEDAEKKYDEDYVCEEN